MSPRPRRGRATLEVGFYRKLVRLFPGAFHDRYGDELRPASNLRARRPV